MKLKVRNMVIGKPNNFGLKKHLLLVSFVLGSNFMARVALADAAVLPVINVGTQDNGCLLVVVPPGNFNAGGNLVIDSTKPGAKALYATALAALTSGKHVWISRVSYGATCYGVGDYANEIRLQNN